ncbi:class I mannose-6-phosphate isomerase (plasmid) [Devosia neptuniae]|uniref:Class I mannose-6-phosphate isomerase n=1 Tax=Devosia neptuniae TaxID=191302 RepID=A0ABY6C698_9HYPH|nr:class I mannose-6-phosphate isomerase [Devosia neptuniae]UXN67822.1 class I mannose-6-phosphate isomerase [Devosia neptuniae]
MGELWYEPADGNAEAPALLLKLLFTEQRLSVQVHPDDAFAQSIGLPNGKTEAWYVLSARHGAQVAIGLKRALTPAELRAAILDGSVAKLIGWRDVTAGEVIYVPAGTIHAIGPGLVIAEIQQRSDATFRMFDYGRDRELHLDNAIAVADANPPAPQVPATTLSEARTVLIANEFFILERLTLLPASSQRLTASGETWIMAISGRLALGKDDLDVGEVALMSAGRTELASGPAGAIVLVAYPGPDVAAGLLEAATHLEVSA